jgi:hypothetical protein
MSWRLATAVTRPAYPLVLACMRLAGDDRRPCQLGDAREREPPLLRPLRRPRVVGRHQPDDPLLRRRDCDRRNVRERRRFRAQTNAAARKSTWRSRAAESAAPANVVAIVRRRSARNDQIARKRRRSQALPYVLPRFGPNRMHSPAMRVECMRFGRGRAGHGHAIRTYGNALATELKETLSRPNSRKRSRHRAQEPGVPDQPVVSR